MAKTVDELVLKMTLEGSAQIKDSTTQMNNLDSATKKTADTMKQSQGNIRNVAFQIQDLAVQIAGGTNAFVALGQQIPQLLGGFGVMGAVIGAVAAVSIPLVRAGLTAMGVDMRDLTERTRDLSESVKNYQEATKLNNSTLQGLGNTFGALTASAKDFYSIQQQLRGEKVFVDLRAAISETKSEYQKFTKEAEQFAKTDLASNAMSRGGALGTLAIGQNVSAFFKGLTVDQAKFVAEALKSIDAAKPEETVVTLNKILTYLKDAGVEADKYKKFFDNTIDPILKLNEQILESKRNLQEAAQQASSFSRNMMALENAAMPDINAARRGFDQITAIRKEGDLKYQQFKYQLDEKTAKDGVDREGELTVFRLKNQQEINDKIADFAKGQSEAFRSASLNNDVKKRQLDLERAIVDLKDKGLFDADYNLKTDEDILRINKEYNDTLISIGEQRRKNQITAQQAIDLEKQAADIRGQAISNSEFVRSTSVRSKMIKDEMDIAKKSIEDQIARRQKLDEIIRGAAQKGAEIKDRPTSAMTAGLSQVQKDLLASQEAMRKASIEAQRSFAATFDTEDMTIEKSKELADGLKAIEDSYRSLGMTEAEWIQNESDIQRSFSYGWSDAFAKYADDAQNAALQAKTYFDSFARGFEDAIVALVTNGKWSFKDFANSIIADFARIEARKMMTNMMGGGSGGGIVGNIITWGKGLLGLAGGGPVASNTPYIVGERGPELFMPRSAGQIIPNSRLAGIGQMEQQPVTVNYNIQAVDASSFRALVARDPSFIYAVTEQGRRSQPTRRLG